jgi:TP901 family phage tail tape measure protein
MAEHTTHYVFELRVEGGKAIEEAKRLGGQLTETLGAKVAQAAERANQSTEKQSKLKNQLLLTEQQLADRIANVTGNSDKLSKSLQAQAETGWKSVEDAANRAAQAMEAATETRVRGNMQMVGAGATDQQALSQALARRQSELNMAQEVYERQQKEHWNAGVQGLQNVLSQRATQLEEMQRQDQQALSQAMTAYQGKVDPARLRESYEYQRQERPIPEEWSRQYGSLQRGEAPREAAPKPHTWLDDFNKGMMEGQTQFWATRRMGYELQNMGRTFTIAAAASAAAMGVMTNSYLGFNEVATRAGMAMELDIRHFAALRSELRDTAEVVGAFDMESLAAGMRQWAAGTGESVQSMEQANRMLEQTVDIQKVAAMNNQNLAETIDNVGGTLKEYGMQTSQSSEVAAVFNYVAAKTFAQVDDLGNAFKMVGPVAQSMGISFSESAATLALLSDQNIKGTMAGRAFRQMLISLMKPTKDMNESLNALAGYSGEVGEAWKEIVFPAGEFMGMPEYIEFLARGVANYTTEEKNRRLAVLATANALPALTALVNQQIEANQYGVNVLRAFEKTMMGTVDQEVIRYKAFYEMTTGLPFSLEGALARMEGDWDKYEQSDAFRAQRLQRQWETAFSRIGEVFTGALLPKLEVGMDLVTRLSKAFEDQPWLADAMIGGTVAVGATGAGLSAVGYGLQQGANLAIILDALRGAGVLGKLATALGGLTALLPMLGVGTLGAVVGTGIRGDTTSEERERMEEVRARTSGRETAWEEFERMFRGEMFGGPGYMPRGTEGAVMMQQVLGREPGLVSDPLTSQEVDKLVWALAQQRVDVEAMNQFARLFTQDMMGRFYPTGEAADVMQRGLGIELTPQQMIGMQPMQALSDKEVAAMLAFLAQELREAAIWAQGWRQEAAGAGDTLLNEMRGLKLGMGMEQPQMAQGPQRPDYWREYAEAYAEYTEEVERREQSLSRRREDIITGFNRWYERAQRDLNRRLAEMDEDELEQQDERRTNHQDKMSRLVEDYQDKEAKQHARHLTSLRRMEEDHRDRLIDLLESRDVRAITKEVSKYRKDRQRAVEDFETARQEREQDHHKRMADEDRRFEEEETKRAIQNEKRRAKMIADLELQRQDRLEDMNQQLADLQKQHDEEMELLRKATQMKLAEIANLRTGLEGFYALMYQDAEWFMRDFKKLWEENVLSLIDKDAADREWEETLYRERDMDYRAGGGYADYGNYRLGEGGREFILSAPTTQRLEDRFGPLTQETFNKVGPSLTFAPIFHGMGAQDQSWYRAAAREEAQRLLREVAEQTQTRRMRTYA